MSLQLLGLDEIQGSLVALDHVKNVSNEEMVSILLNNGSRRKVELLKLKENVPSFRCLKEQMD